MSAEKSIAPRQESLVEYVPLGCADRIKLSVAIVQNLIAVPTRSGKTCSRNDALKFIGLCYARRMNPLTGDCFLLGFDTQSGPKFEFITAYQSLIARAEQSEQFDGMASGVIVREGPNGKLVEQKGDFFLETQELLGAWALVKRKDRSLPFEDRLELRRYQKMNDKGQPMARWAVDPGGMLVKCTEASCLRRAFPTACGGLYLREEIGEIGEGLGLLPTPEIAGNDSARDEDVKSASSGSDTGKPAAETVDSPQAMLAALAQENGLSFDAYQRWGQETGNDKEAGSRTDWSEIPDELAKRMLRVKPQLIAGLKKFEKGGGQ